MAESKTYLNVPYAQKDAAKALGARWDAAYKKWYVPANKDITLFAQWQPQAGTLELPTAIAGRSSASSNNTSSGAITYATDKEFIAYNGDEPPWN